MENVNLKDAQQGTSTEKKQGKTEYRILSEASERWVKERIGDSDSFSQEHSAWVRFYRNARGHETRPYRVADALVFDGVVKQKLKVYDLVKVRFSEDGQEVVEMEKLGHLYFNGELDK